MNEVWTTLDPLTMECGDDYLQKLLEIFHFSVVKKGIPR
jgi:hypothetical protein